MKQSDERSPLVHYHKNATFTGSNRTRCVRKWRVLIGVCAVLLVSLSSAVAAVLIIHGRSPDGLSSHGRNPDGLSRHMSIQKFKSSLSQVGYFTKEAVATAVKECSTIGREILDQGGSTTDAAIAATMCVGIYNFVSCGVGGGSLMVIYDSPRNSTQKELLALDARETAPLASTKDMLKNTSLKSLRIGVPGEISGYWAAWKKFGKLPWKKLFEPNIKLVESGFRIKSHLAGLIESTFKNTKPEDVQQGLRELIFTNDGVLRKEGDIITRPLLATTLQMVADHGPQVFYDGELTESIVQDIKDNGGIITKEDLVAYATKERSVRQFHLEQAQLRVATMSEPSGGPMVEVILKVMDGYNWTNVDVPTRYHRLVESMKFAFAEKTKLGDPDFVNDDQVLANISSKQYIDWMRSRITDNSTHDIMYYYPATKTMPPNHGTAHISVYSTDGSAVAITSTINGLFGSGIVGTRTGILFNNEMNDFSSPDDTSEVSHAKNWIEPGKRPQSSMSPCIVFDESSSRVRYVIGAAGSELIISTVASVLVNHIYFNQDLLESMDFPRLHHPLIPNRLAVELDMAEYIVAHLKSLGHAIQLIQPTSGCQVIEANRDAAFPIEAVSDYRTAGAPDGI